MAEFIVAFIRYMARLTKEQKQASFGNSILPTNDINVDILVVTPTLGDRPGINQTIESVNAVLGHRVFHCIIGPFAKIFTLKNRFPHIHLLDEPSPNGVYSALNFAIACYARNFTYFAYINDDDF